MPGLGWNGGYHREVHIYIIQWWKGLYESCERTWYTMYWTNTLVLLAMTCLSQTQSTELPHIQTLLWSTVANKFITTQSPLTAVNNQEKYCFDRRNILHTKDSATHNILPGQSYSQQWRGTVEICTFLRCFLYISKLVNRHINSQCLTGEQDCSPVEKSINPQHSAHVVSKHW